MFDVNHLVTLTPCNVGVGHHSECDGVGPDRTPGLAHGAEETVTLLRIVLNDGDG